MDKILTSTVTIVMAIIGVAILAVIVSKNSNTVGVLGASSNAFSNILGTALSPINGSNNFSNMGGGFGIGG